MYIPLAQAGLNDVKGLLNLATKAKQQIAPLLDLAGKSKTHLQTFCDEWPEDLSFFVDISPMGIELCKAVAEADEENHVILTLNLDNPKNGFTTRQNLYLALHKKHQGLIPCISWENTDATRRDVLLFARSLEENFNKIAIRICLWNEISDHQKNLDYAKAILDVVRDRSKVWLLIDYGPLRQDTEIATSKKMADFLEIINSTSVAGWSIISTSFPAQRPSSGEEQRAQLLDYTAQSLIKTRNKISQRAYGDYAASALGSATQFTPGMIVIPFGAYLADFEWWLHRDGGSSEFRKYIDIAKKLISLPQFDGAGFCWANENYERISQLPPAATRDYGNNGVWNGYRLNQHITKICHYLEQYGFPLSLQATSVEEEDGEI